MTTAELSRDDLIQMAWEDIGETLDWLQKGTGFSDEGIAGMLEAIADSRSRRAKA
jgi:hypothetical protein